MVRARKSFIKRYELFILQQRSPPPVHQRTCQVQQELSTQLIVAGRQRLGAVAGYTKINYQATRWQILWGAIVKDANGLGIQPLDVVVEHLAIVFGKVDLAILPFLPFLLQS